MEHVRDSSKNLQLLSKLLLTAPFSAQPAAEPRAVPGSIEADSTGVHELAAALSQKNFEDTQGAGNYQSRHPALIRAPSAGS